MKIYVVLLALVNENSSLLNTHKPGAPRRATPLRARAARTRHYSRRCRRARRCVAHLWWHAARGRRARRGASRQRGWRAAPAPHATAAARSRHGGSLGGFVRAVRAAAAARPPSPPAAHRRLPARGGGGAAARGTSPHAAGGGGGAVAARWRAACALPLARASTVADGAGAAWLHSNNQSALVQRGGRGGPRCSRLAAAALQAGCGGAAAATCTTPVSALGATSGDARRGAAAMGRAQQAGRPAPMAPP